MLPLPQSTASTVIVGPIVEADGLTPVTASKQFRISKNGGAYGNTTNMTVYRENGEHALILSTSDLNTLGRIRISYWTSPNGTSPLHVFHDFQVMTLNAYNAYYGADGVGKIKLEQLSAISNTSSEAAFEAKNTVLGIGFNCEGKGSAQPGMQVSNIDSGGVGLGIVSGNIALKISPGISADSHGIQVLSPNGNAIKAEATGGAYSGIVARGQGVGKDIDAAELAELAAEHDTLFAEHFTLVVNQQDLSTEHDTLQDQHADIITAIGTSTGDLNDSTVNKQIIAKAFRSEDVSSTPAVAGSNFESIDTELQKIIGKLPSGTLSDFNLSSVVDGITVDMILQLSMAMMDGRIRKDTPNVGDLTFYKRDNTSILTITRSTETERSRVVIP